MKYDIYVGLEQWGFRHKTVNHSAGEYARDEDGQQAQGQQFFPQETQPALNAPGPVTGKLTRPLKAVFFSKLGQSGTDQ